MTALAQRPKPYTPRHATTPESVVARARWDAQREVDRAVLLLAAHDPHGLFDTLLAAGALPLGESA